MADHPPRARFAAQPEEEKQPAPRLPDFTRFMRPRPVPASGKRPHHLCDRSPRSPI